jgi:pyruvate dehydrogenase E2 component (dihydrolipoamide acetyltransferase)
MAVEFLMPKLGLTMESGTIVSWLVDDGQAVAAGDAVLLIETDKVETEVESPAAGILHHAGTVGTAYDCGEVIALLLADGEAPPAPAAPSVPAAATPPNPTATVSASAPAPAPARNGRLHASPNARRVAASLGVALSSVRGSGPGGRILSEDVEEHAARPPAATAPPTTTATSWGEPNPSSTTPATAAARQLADLLGIDLRLVAASSGDGRRSREDVAAHVRAQLAASVAPRTPVLQQPTEVIPLTGMRGVIAERMHASLREMAQLTLHLDAPMAAVAADRAERKRHGAAPGVTDYLIAAVARALREHPIVNSQVTDAGIALLPDVHVGMAVAIDGGLVVPVVRHADRLDLDTLSAETTRLADAARARKLPLADLEGGTFSVTALGMFGVDGFTPVVNAPNVAILGAGRIRDAVRVDGGELVTEPVLTLSLTWDHRAFDGAPAAMFTARVAELLTDPARLDRTA